MLTPDLKRVLRALILLSGKSRGGRLPLTAVRPKLAGMSRAEQDAALKALQRESLLVLYRNDNTPSLTAEDKAAALFVGDSPRHLVYLDERELAARASEIGSSQTQRARKKRTAKKRPEKKRASKAACLAARRHLAATVKAFRAEERKRITAELSKKRAALRAAAAKRKARIRARHATAAQKRRALASVDRSLRNALARLGARATRARKRVLSMTC